MCLHKKYLMDYNKLDGFNNNILSHIIEHESTPVCYLPIRLRDRSLTKNTIWSLGLPWTKTSWRHKKMLLLRNCTVILRNKILYPVCRSTLVYLLKVRHPVRLIWIPHVQRCDKIEQMKLSGQNKVLLRSCKLAVDHGTAININAPYTGKQPLTRVTTNDYEIVIHNMDVFPSKCCPSLHMKQ